MAKHHLTRSNLVLAFLALLGLALTIDFLWASSPSSAASTLALQKHHLIEHNPENGTISESIKVENVDERELSATFADLPARKLEWEQMPSAPVPRLDGSPIHIKNLLYVFAGFETLDHVVFADVYMLDAKMEWKELPPMPKPNSHIESSWVIVNSSIVIVGGTTRSIQ